LFSDPSPGQRASDILQGSADIFSIAFNHSPLALTITAVDDGRLVAVNEAFVRVAGYSRDEVIGRSPDEVGLWVEPGRRAERFAELLAGRNVPDLEARFRLKNGEIRVGLIGSALVEIGGRRCVLSSVLDITDRTLAEARARDREERYELVLAGAEAAIWDWDVTARRVMYSPRWKQLRGLSDAEVTDSEDEWLRTIHPDDLPRVRAAITAHFEGHTPVFAEEYRVRRKDGSWLWIADRGVARRDANGRVVRMAGSETDISARKAAEQALRASEERYRAIVESQVELVCRFRADGEILFVNAAYARARGTTADELTGRNLWAFVDEADHQAVKAQLDRLCPDVTEVSIENRFEAVEGTRWMLWTNRALAFDGDGRPTELQASGVDITDRKARERDAAFLGAMTDELSQLSDPHEIIRRVSASIVEHLGALRCVFTELDSSRQQLAVIGEATRDGSTLRTSLRLHDFFSDDLLTHLGSGRQVAVGDTCEDPRTKHNQASFARLHIGAFVTTPYVSDGIWKGSLAVHDDAPRSWTPETLDLLSDLSGRVWARLERARAEQKLRESEAELRRASELKDEFLATLSHELRTPLNAVLGWAHMLRTGAVAPDAVPRALEAVERNARAQSQLVDDLLDMSRIISGKLPIHDDIVELVAVASAAEETVRPAAMSRGLTFELDVSAGPGLQVRGDAHRLRQVLWNLLSNAVKFTPAGGHVHLRIARDGDDAVIVVRDTGEGIDASFLPLVFERFRQADSSPTRRHSGLGLGLAITVRAPEDGRTPLRIGCAFQSFFSSSTGAGDPAA
jgi:PAS domain S-box-containing protein